MIGSCGFFIEFKVVLFAGQYFRTVGGNCLVESGRGLFAIVQRKVEFAMLESAHNYGV